jgi:hypothetical protein
MTATETHRNAVRARWRPDLRGLRGGSASPGKNGSGRFELYWLPVYRVSPAYRGGLLRCPLPRPEGCGSCACGRSGRLITPKLTQSTSGCCCDLAQTPHIWGRLARHCAPFDSIHCHSPPAGRPTPTVLTRTTTIPAHPLAVINPWCEGAAPTHFTNPRGRMATNRIYLHSRVCNRSEMNNTCPP